MNATKLTDLYKILTQLQEKTSNLTFSLCSFDDDLVKLKKFQNALEKEIMRLSEESETVDEFYNRCSNYFSFWSFSNNFRR